jgi:P2 family phage contractile tail tube protein
MSLPKKLVNCNLFIDGVSFLGQVPEVTLPKIERKTEDYMAGGMIGNAQVPTGAFESMNCEWMLGGISKEVLAGFKVTNVNGVLLRFAAALKADDTGQVTAFEAVMRGYHKVYDFGTSKPGDKTENKVESALTYYKLSMNGQAVIEIDFVNMIEVIDGVDVQADIRRALGV